MAEYRIAVMGATGHIGRVLTENLLRNGHKVHAIGRDKNKLQRLKDRGAEVFSASFDDAAALEQAFTGCNVAFTFIPPGYDIDNYSAYQDKVIEAICNAIEKSKISHVVNLSSIGADLPEGTGPIKGLHRLEERLNAIPNLNVLHFRPGYFMENLLLYINLIRKEGIIGSIIKSSLKIPMVATEDIAIKAAEFFNLAFEGHSVFEFVGPQDIKMTEATKAIGKVIGKPDLTYVEFPILEAEKRMIAAGMKPNSIKLILEMYQAFNEGKIRLTQKLTAENQGKTTIEEFAKANFGPIFNTEQLTGSKK